MKIAIFCTSTSLVCGTALNSQKGSDQRYGMKDIFGENRVFFLVGIDTCTKNVERDENFYF